MELEHHSNVYCYSNWSFYLNYFVQTLSSHQLSWGCTYFVFGNNHDQGIIYSFLSFCLRRYSRCFISILFLQTRKNHAVDTGNFIFYMYFISLHKSRYCTTNKTIESYQLSQLHLEEVKIKALWAQNVALFTYFSQERSYSSKIFPMKRTKFWISVNKFVQLSFTLASMFPL